jgi:hypothetical protein
MKRTLFLLAWLFSVCLPAQEIMTVAESSDYAKTSLYDDVMNFLHQVQKKSDLIKILPLATSSEGRLIPLVVLSKEKISRPADLQMVGKPAVLVMANIHAGEIEGKEASLMLIRDIALGKLAGLLDTQVLLFVPIFNADGNDKLGHNRHDLGPELAGVRFNGQNLDRSLRPGDAFQFLGSGAGRGHAYYQRFLSSGTGNLFDLAQSQQLRKTA